MSDESKGEETRHHREDSTEAKKHGIRRGSLINTFRGFLPSGVIDFDADGEEIKIEDIVEEEKVEIDVVQVQKDIDLEFLTVADQNEFIIDKLALYRGSSDIVGLCLKKILTLASGHGDNRKKLLANGGVDCILNSIRDHGDDERIQYQGSWTLACLGADPEEAILIGQSGGLEIILHAIKSDPKGQGAQGCRALINLLKEESNVKRAKEMNLETDLREAMSAAISDGTFQWRAQQVIASLAS